MTKNTIFGYFRHMLRLEVPKSNCHIQISTINFIKTQKKTFGTEKTLFRYFGVVNLKNLLSYLKSAPSNFPKCNISCKNKTSKFGTKMPYLGIFRLKFEETVVILKSLPSNFS